MEIIYCKPGMTLLAFTLKNYEYLQSVVARKEQTKRY